MEISNNKLSQIARLYDKEEFLQLHDKLTFSAYIDLIHERPKTVRTAFQRIYDMIIEPGSHQFEIYRKQYTHYNFFDDEDITIYGLEETKDRVVKFIRGAAGGYGTEKRILLIHGPVGSAKSTIARLLKRRMEAYSKTADGAWYSYEWHDLPTGPQGIYTHDTDPCPMNEEPLKLMPLLMRKKVLADLNEKHREITPEEKRKTLYDLRCEGELCPRCKKFMNELLARNDGDWLKVVQNHITVVRKSYSESDRIGIGTFQPKDEKNQDATELSGDVNWGKLPHYGSDSDARAFNFDGELNVGNRGLCEFIEVLKLDVAFLYDLLGASQEKQIKPKKFPQISIDEMLLGHTNNPEFVRLQGNEFMEALKDRTVKVDCPYLLRLSDEIKVLKHDYNPSKVRQHIAPHTIEIAALWLILTRLQDDKEHKLDLVTKAKLYNGEVLPNYNEDMVKELLLKYSSEGMTGVSVRYAQDKLSNCLSDHFDYINPFMVMNEIKDGLENHPLINKKEDLKKYFDCWDLAMKELDEILKDEVRKALVGDEKAIVRLCQNYIDNLLAYVHNRKIRNQVTGRDEKPNERLMRSIEEKIDVPSGGIDDFRRMIAAFIGDLAQQNKKFAWDSNPELKKALEAELFAKVKDTIKLSLLDRQSSVVEPDIQDKIDMLKKRMVDQYGYNEQSATDVLEYVGSIFSRGENTKDQ